MLHLQNYKFQHRVSQTSVQFSSYLTCLTTVFTTIYVIRDYRAWEGKIKKAVPGKPEQLFVYCILA